MFNLVKIMRGYCRFPQARFKWPLKKQNHAFGLCEMKRNLRKFKQFNMNVNIKQPEDRSNIFKFPVRKHFWMAENKQIEKISLF